MNETRRGSSAAANDAERGSSHGVIGVHGVRYQVKDVARAAAFYADHLGFTLEHQQLPAFASVSLGGFTLLLSGPGASGSSFSSRLTTRPIVKPHEGAQDVRSNGEAHD